jgi:uncharacterized protein (DUF488 family)
MKIDPCEILILNQDFSLVCVFVLLLALAQVAELGRRVVVNVRKWQSNLLQQHMESLIQYYYNYTIV